MATAMHNIDDATTLSQFSISFPAFGVTIPVKPRRGFLIKLDRTKVDGFVPDVCLFYDPGIFTVTLIIYICRN